MSEGRSQADSYVISTKLGIRKFQKSGAGAVENCLVVPQKVKIIYAPTIPHLRNILKKIRKQVFKQIHAPMFTAALFGTAGGTQVSAHELVNRQTKIRYTLK